MTTYQKITKAFFLNRQGKPFDLTAGQSDIFRLIYDPSILRATIKTITQYGKSDTAALATIWTMVDLRKKVLLIAPSMKQAQIIMSYIIQHLFDHPYLTKMIEYEGSLEQLQKERSKKRITIRNGGEVMVLTADVRTVSQEARQLMGFGADVVIVDESSLILDTMFSKILRMVGGREDGKIVQLGNPFERNHFFRSFHSDRYEKLSIDYKQAIAEGRITQDFVNEMREEMSDTEFKIFYEVDFPVGGAEDSLVPYSWLDVATNQEVGGDKRQAGLDVARFGRDKTVYVFRVGGRTQRIEEISNKDTMEVVAWTRNLIDEDKPEVTAIDIVGIGSGVHDRLDELGYAVQGINVGEKPSTEKNQGKFYNLRAEIFWNLRKLFRPEDDRSSISIPDDKELKRQLVELRYKFSSEKKIRLESKDDMKRRLGVSPDKADALALAFYELTLPDPDVMFL